MRYIGRGRKRGLSPGTHNKTATDTSTGKSFSFPTRLLSPSGSAVQKSTPLGSPSARSLGQALVKNHGHDVPSAYCAYSCALGDECAERVCSARSRRYARLCRACSNRNAPSFQAFCSPARGNDSLAHRIHQRISSQLYGWRTRTASLKAAKLV